MAVRRPFQNVRQDLRRRAVPVKARYPETEADEEPLVIKAQGSFAVGGVVTRGPDGHTRHGDHAYVSYQIPVNSRRLPLVMLHGNQQFSKTWETTPDGREGFQNIFLRRGFSIYLVDQPRRGRAGQVGTPGTITATPEDQKWFNIFRVGIWPDYFPGVQFARDEETLDQYFRQSTPNTAPFDLDVSSKAIASLHEKIGPSVLVTHSQGGGVGWYAAMKTPNIRGIVSYEPGSNFPFPPGEVPEPLQSSGGPLAAEEVELAEFQRLTRIPIIIYYGDFIPKTPSDSFGQDLWRIRVAMARKWVEAINRHGGDAKVVELPEIGITGNTHFPFSDLNNVQIADLMSEFLAAKGLD
jgi:pimeloyl-ACP methyl ester carboxylesterase